VSDQKTGWKKQSRPSSLRQLAGTLEQIQAHLHKESEKTAERAMIVAKEALKTRG